MQMKAVLKTKPEVGAELRLVERPEVTPGHLLVKVLATALCHSDFDVYNYAPSVAAQNLKMPWIMGHEFFGEIVQVGQGVEGFAVGDRISSDSHVPCGYCHTCITGNQHICDNTMTVLGRTHPGCFAEYINLPAVAAVKMPKETRPECGALMEPFGVAVHAIQQAEIAGQTLVITGLGTIGMMALASARFLGATRIIAVSTSEEKLKMAEELGADFGINSRTQDVVQAVREATDGIGSDRVIEMTGVVRFFNLAIDMLAPAGRLVCVGNYNEDVVIPNYQMRVMNKELTITGIFGRRMFETWELAKELVVSGHVKLERFIGEIMPLTDFDRGAKIAPKTFGRIVYLP